MNLNITLDQNFTADERNVLERFSDAIKANWVQSSNSTSNLSWKLELADSDPRRIGVLVANDSRKEIIREPLYSLANKRVEKFTEEFCEKARQYGAQMNRQG